MSHRRVGLIALFSFTAVLALVCALGAITSFAFENKVLPRTTVAGVEVSNLTYPQAQAKIAQHATELQNLKISFALKDKSANISLRQLGVKIDEQSALSEVIRPSNTFDWLSPRFWSAIFNRKELAFNFSGDAGTMRKSVETNLGITTTAQDATISYAKGILVTQPGQKGVSVSDAIIDTAIKKVLTTGNGVFSELTFTESDPIITTDSVNQTKSEIEQKFIPIHLVLADQNLTVIPSEEFSFLDFTPTGNKIVWQVSTSKIKGYLNSAVAPKINIKMLPKTTQFDTGQVSQEGREGRQADLNRLAADIARSITEQIDTASSPIAINVTAIPFTEKIVYPNYIANLFPGLYADVNLRTQQMFILNGPTLLNTYLISSGKAGLPTPTGQYYVCNKIPIARSPLYPSLWMPLWNALSTSPDSCAGYNGYGTHGLPCFNSSCTLVESAAHLGRPVSHGCIRLPDDGAQWFYDNMPVGTPVNVHT